MTTVPRFCVACHAPIPSGSEVCANCGAYQYASSAKTTPPYQQYREPFQPPNGMRVDVSLQAAPGQYVLLMSPAIAAMPLARHRNSGFAMASMALGIAATVLAVINLLFDGRAALDQHDMPTPLGIILLLAFFCWAPALFAFIFGLLAKSRIWNSSGQVQGLDLAYTGITLGSIGLVLPLLGVILFALSLLP